jgi:hypothetical protein
VSATKDLLSLIPFPFLILRQRGPRLRGERNEGPCFSLSPTIALESRLYFPDSVGRVNEIFSPVVKITSFFFFPTGGLVT